MNTAVQRDIPLSSDALGETLYSLRLNGVVYAQSEFSAPWGVDMPPMPGKMMFHLVTKGHCVIALKDQNDLYLNEGDLVLIPKGEGHYISSSTEVHFQPFFDLPIKNLSDRFEFVRYGGGGEETHITCGVLGFDHSAGQKLVANLPYVIHIPHGEDGLVERLSFMQQFIAEEAMSLLPGGETVVAHLADIVVIQAIRFWLQHAPEANEGWLGALKDPKIGKAIAAIHAKPDSAWTVDSLAREAGMSRSGFSARFTEMIGTSVKQYLTEWRMSLARMKIMQSNTPLAEIAEQLGYQSEAAFSRAYKRVMGQSPVRHRA